MAAVDAAAPEPVDVLIDRAGAAVARTALQLLGGGYGRRVVVVAGKGNNGADGRAAATRLRRRGVVTEVIDATAVPRDLPVADLVVDAAYGTGFRGEYRAPDAAGAPILAVDVPSGVDGLTGEIHGEPDHALVTVTFAALKPGLLLHPGRSLAGEVVLAPIGLDCSSAAAGLVEVDDVTAWTPARAADAHKWRGCSAGRGRLAGHDRRGSSGCRRGPTSRARACCASRRRVCSTTPPVPPRPSAVEAPRHGWAPAVLATVDRAGAAVVGPGLGRHDADVGEIRRVVTEIPIPLVVDGDGLSALDVDAAALIGKRTAPTVLTPHDGEAERLLGRRPGPDRLGEARELAATMGAVVLLKGPTTVVADPAGEARFVTTGDARLATAGTGDVLAGIISALLARGASALDAAAAGAWLHGRAGEPRPTHRADRLRCGRSTPRRPCRGRSLGPCDDALVGRGRPRRDPPQRRGSAGPGCTRPALRRCEGRWLRPRHRSSRAGRPCRRRRRGWQSHMSTKGPSCERRGSTCPSCCSPSPAPTRSAAAVSLGLDVTAYRGETIAAIAAAGRADDPLQVHLKVDTGMHRVGAAPADAPALAKAVVDAPELELAGVWTHLAVADEPDEPYTADQVDRFEAVLEQLVASGIEPRLRHAANSAGTIWHPSSRFDLVRCGIAIYGISPAPGVAVAVPLEPALRWSTEVSFVKPLAAGERVSYGLRHRVGRDTTVVTLPVGYADGVRRDSGLLGQQVLIGGRRHPIIGTVTMDQLLVDVGPQSDVQVGDEAVLVGKQGDEQVTAEDWALRAGTIGYEIVCSIGSRVERRYR